MPCAPHHLADHYVHSYLTNRMLHVTDCSHIIPQMPCDLYHQVASHFASNALYVDEFMTQVPTAFWVGYAAPVQHVQRPIQMWVSYLECAVSWSPTCLTSYPNVSELSWVCSLVVANMFNVLFKCDWAVLSEQSHGLLQCWALWSNGHQHV